jgi:DNA mismatch repair protein MutS
LASVFFDNKSRNFFLDVSTGEFASQGNAEYIDKLLQNFSPSEVLIQKNKKMISRKILVMITVLFRRLDLQKDYAFEILTKHFQTVSLKVWYCRRKKELLRQEPFCITYPKHNTIGTTYHHDSTAEDAYVWMDRFTIRNLELYHSYNPNAVTLM